jgi:hypothetical protein
MCVGSLIGATSVDYLAAWPPMFGRHQKPHQGDRLATRGANPAEPEPVISAELDGGLGQANPLAKSRLQRLAPTPAECVR